MAGMAAMVFTNVVLRYVLQQARQTISPRRWVGYFFVWLEPSSARCSHFREQWPYRGSETFGAGMLGSARQRGPPPPCPGASNRDHLICAVGSCSGDLDASTGIKRSMSAAVVGLSMVWGLRRYLIFTGAAIGRRSRFFASCGAFFPNPRGGGSRLGMAQFNRRDTTCASV